jgi:hypothetical protein
MWGKSHEGLVFLDDSDSGIFGRNNGTFLDFSEKDHPKMFG